MMIHRKLFNIKLFISFSLLIGLGFSQPKLNIQLGGGFYSPSLIGLDPDSNNVLPSCSWVSGEYGISDVYLGVPTKLGKDGVTEIVELD